jgi:two-component system response regulator MprA
MTMTIDTPTLPSSVRPRRRLRVLLVDDVRAEREIYCTHLRGAGYDVQVATDGLEAIACAVVRRPDAIVIDVGTVRLDTWTS